MYSQQALSEDAWSAEGSRAYLGGHSGSGDQMTAQEPGKMEFVVLLLHPGLPKMGIRA